MLELNWVKRNMFINLRNYYSSYVWIKLNEKTMFINVITWLILVRHFLKNKCKLIETLLLE